MIALKYADDHSHLIAEILNEVKPRKIVVQVIAAAYADGYEKKSDGITLMPELAFASLKMKHPAGVGHDWIYFMGMSNPFLPKTITTEWKARLWCDNWFSDALKDFGHPIRARVWWIGLRVGGWRAWKIHRDKNDPYGKK
jgi:REP element-mobilizing transposase RayT